MMRFIAILTLILAGIISPKTSFAAHEMGGEVTWQFMPNGKVKFRVAVYYDCNLTSVSPPTTFFLSNNAGLGSIQCNAISATNISPQCSKANVTLTCGIPQAQGEYAIRRIVFESSEYTLVGVPPAGGWYFRGTLLSRQTSNVTTSAPIVFESRMYAISKNGVPQNVSQTKDSSPQLDEYPHLSFISNTEQEFAVTTLSDPDYDSVFVALAPSKTTGGNTMNYMTGYSYLQPMAHSSGLNGSFCSALNGHTGQYKFKTFPGFYSMAYEISSYREGQLLSTVHRELTYMVETQNAVGGMCDTVVNVPPTVWATAESTSSVPLTSIIDSLGEVVYYSAKLTPGHQLSFTISASDSGITANCTPQLISCTVLGSEINTTAQMPIVSPSGSGGANVGFYTLNRQLTWAPDTSVIPGFGTRYFHFRFAFKDDRCIIPGTREISILVTLEDETSISSHQLAICQGDSIQATASTRSGQVEWSPSVGVSNPHDLSPWFYPNQTTVYTITDTVFGTTDTLQIVVDTLTPPVILQNLDGFELVNPATTSLNLWSINGAPADDNNASIVANYSGEYQLFAKKGGCEAWSNNLDTNIFYSLSLNPVNQRLSMEASQDSVTRSIEVKNISGSEQMLESVVLFMEATATPVVELSILNSNGVLVFQTDSVTIINNFMIELATQTPLDAGETYTFVLAVDRARKQHLYTPAQWPVIQANNLVEVSNPKVENGFVANPSQVSTNYPFMHLQLRNNIGLAEWSSSLPTFHVYPNPTTNIVYLPKDGNYFVYNVLGQEVSRVNNASILDMQQFPNGVYFVKNDKNQSAKIIKN